MKKWLSLIVFAAVSAAVAAEFSVKPENAVIVVDQKAGRVARLAAKELQYFIKMMTGKTVPVSAKAAPGKYVFLFEKPANVKLKPEEAVWETTKKQTRFYGDSSYFHPRASDDAVFRSRSRTGDLTAVYDFLERQLNFLFLAPGTLGTSYTPGALLKLKEGKNSWDPGRLVKRGLRPGTVEPKRVVNDLNYPEFYRQKAKTDLPKRNQDVYRWLKQMRMGSSAHFSYGHAFTTWWHKYGAKHPEYFALHNGKRAPWGSAANVSNIKMCPSNRGLIKQIVENWKSQKHRSPMINVCENDWGNYCKCAQCLKLDAPKPGEAWNAHLTDRYIWMANEVIKEARKIDPKVKVGFYAYSVYRYPPRKFKVEPGIVIGFVPAMNSYQKTDEMYKEWRKWGAREMFQRPNDQHINTGLPMGFEEIMFKHFQVGYKNGMIGTDYDSIHGFWASTGIADYILARAHVYPERTFEEHLNEYTSAYGAAAPEVKAYYAYWRKEMYEKRLMPNREKIAQKGRYGNFRRGLMWDLDKYYTVKDFDTTDAILKKGLKKKLGPRQRELLEQLLLSNQHARLTYLAIAAKGANKLPAAKKLHDFREANWDKVNMYWHRLFNIEAGFGDVTGGKLAGTLKNFSQGTALSEYWFFAPDPKNEGEKLNWKNTLFTEAEACWERVCITTGWENPGRYAHPGLRKFMKNYDGIGWYALRLAVPKEWKGKKICLLFGAVDESAWVYLNGKYCGERVFKDPDDWKKSFSIRIDQNINWNNRWQTIVVKVRDTNGQGGIYRPVTLAVE